MGKRPANGRPEAPVDRALRAGCAGLSPAFPAVCGASTAEKMYRLLRTCCAHAEQRREPFTGALECDQTTFGGARHGPRGWGRPGQGDRVRDHQAQRSGQGDADRHP